MIATPHVSQPITNNEDEGEINFSEYLDIVLDNKWLVSLIAALTLCAGISYALLAMPVYETNLLIQVEDSEKSAGSFLGDAASSLFDVKTPAAGEIEIIKSRLILGQAVENTKSYIDAQPRYIPIVGNWLARRATQLSHPGIFGYGGFVYGTEKIVVPRFDVPQEFEGTKFKLTLKSNGEFLLTSPQLSKSLEGVVGKALIEKNEFGEFQLLVSEIDGEPGAQFQIVRFSKQLTTNELQNDIKVSEKGKQSGVLDVSLQSTNPERMTQLLNEVGRLYVRQNIDRKAAEALKTLGFLDNQLPQFKRQLEQSEEVYNRYRNQKGTVSLDDEARNALSQLVALQGNLVEAQQKRRELSAKFTDNHPAIQTLDAQVAAWNSEIASVNSKIKLMPLMQQDTVRMQRDIKVNTDLYQSLLNSSLQMQLAKEGKVGNVRLLDDAVLPEESIRPKRSLIVLISALIGLISGIAAAMGKSMFFGGIRNPQEIEAHTGLSVYSTIPLSEIQVQLAKDVQNKKRGIHLLAFTHPQDPAIESLRSLRTALQFVMLEAPNNRVLITGGTPGVGKSFVSVNFAAIMAAAGKHVLLIDADLRKGYINQFFSIGRAGGISELIAGSINVEKAVHREVLPNLDLITTGLLPPNPAELLMSDSFAALLQDLSVGYDLVIIDSPPVLVAADTAALAPHVGTVLLVARSEKTQLGELNESAKRLAHAGRVVNGVLFNAIDLSRRHYGSYGYKYGSYRYTQYSYNANNSD